MKKIIFIVFLILVGSAFANPYVEEKFEEYGVDLVNYEGQELPGKLGAILSNERINIYVDLNNGETAVGSLVIKKGVIWDIKLETLKKPTVNVYFSESTVDKILNSKNRKMVLKQAIDNREVTYEGVGFFNKLKFKVASFLQDLFR